MSVQATSPLFARRSYWCIIETMRAAGFGQWRIEVALRALLGIPHGLAMAEQIDRMMHGCQRSTSRFQRLVQSSLSRNTPYVGRELPGRVVATFLRGAPTVLDGKLA